MHGAFPEVQSSPDVQTRCPEAPRLDFVSLKLSDIHPEFFRHHSLRDQIGEHKEVAQFKTLPSTDLDPGLALCVLNPSSALYP